MLDAIIGKKITEIYTVGYIDLEDGQGEYYPDLRWIYFEFEDILIEFESFKQYSRLRVQKVDDIRYLFELDEDMIRAKSSIKEIVLICSFLLGNEVKSVELENGTEMECEAARITLENGQTIFIDPTFLHGIGVGGKEQEEYWKYANS